MIYEQAALNSKSIKVDKHISNCGYEHRFVVTADNFKNPKVTCDVCNEVYNRHMDRLVTFRYGDYNARNPQYLAKNENRKIKRSHSVSERDMSQLRSLNFNQHSEDYHLM